MFVSKKKYDQVVDLVSKLMNDISFLERELDKTKKPAVKKAVAKKTTAKKATK